MVVVTLTSDNVNLHACRKDSIYDYGLYVGTIVQTENGEQEDGETIKFKLTQEQMTKLTGAFYNDPSSFRNLDKWRMYV